MYTNSVVNREDYLNVVTNFDMLTHAAPDEVSDSIKELFTRIVWGGRVCGVCVCVRCLYMCVP